MHTWMIHLVDELDARRGRKVAEGGRRKKFYHLEGAGAVALARSLSAHRGMIEGIEAELDLLAAGGGEGGR